MLLLLTGSSPTCGKLVVPTVLSSDMVLPADNATLWGSATAGATVSLKLTRGTAPAVAQTSIADANGHWAFHLGDISPSTEPANLTLSGDGGSKTLARVMFGLLVFCSGQSNSQFFQSNHG